MANLPLLPPSANFWGVFLTPLPAGDYNTWWSSFDFNGNFKPQLDQAITDFGKGTLVILFGSNITGHTNLAQYIANRKTVWDYCLKIGLRVLTYATGTISDWIGTITINQAATVAAADALVCSQYPNHLGYVCMDEVYALSNTNGTLTSQSTTLYNGAKSLVPSNFPIAVTSNPCGNITNVFEYDGANSSQANLDALSSPNDLNDFLCFNPHAASVSSDLTNLRAAFPNKVIIFGGSNSQTSDGAANTVTTALSALIGTNNCKGNAYFCYEDYDVNAYGLYSGPIPTGPRSSRITTIKSNLKQPVAPIVAVRNSFGSPIATQIGAFGYTLNS